MGGGEEEEFFAISLEVFAYQFKNNPAYRNYCEALGLCPKTISSWHEIPAVPTDIFKLQDYSIIGFPSSEVGGHFLTSGTTKEIRGKHEYRNLQLYEASVKGTWRELGLPKCEKAWFLSQDTTSAPHSSLTKMFSILDEDGIWLIDQNGRICSQKFRPHDSPNAILGTSIAFLEFCKQTAPYKLAEDSWILETGGSKGMRESFSAEEVRLKIACHFDIPESKILNEYGMTELFSQFYRWGNQDAHRGAPWTAIRVRNLETGNIASQGEVGYLEMIDLANLESVMAVQTQDFAIALGDREFILLGRDSQAVAKGCSREAGWLLNKKAKVDLS